MAKKFVRGITDIKTISNQDFDTNNVNDLLSDGQHNYIHRKKGTTEEYHNLTDNLKTVSSDNTDLLEVTNDNETTNSATLHPKHDSQKEQSIESTRNTITVEHANNATSETTKVDTNPTKVLEHENLLTDYGISKNTTENTTKLGIEYSLVSHGYDLNNLTNGRVKAGRLVNAPEENTWFFVSAFSEGEYTIQDAIKLLDNGNKSYRRLKYNGVWGEWREQLTDKSVIDTLLLLKQNNLSSSDSIGVLSNNKLTQLINFKNTYYVTNGFLKTHIRSIAESSAIDTPLKELYLNIKIKQGVTSISFILNERDTNAFFRLLQAYNTNNTAKLNGYIFSLTGSKLTVQPPTTDYDQGMTFSDILI